MSISSPTHITHSTRRPGAAPQVGSIHTSTRVGPMVDKPGERCLCLWKGIPGSQAPGCGLDRDVLSRWAPHLGPRAPPPRSRLQPEVRPPSQVLRRVLWEATGQGRRGPLSRDLAKEWAAPTALEKGTRGSGSHSAGSPGRCPHLGRARRGPVEATWKQSSPARCLKVKAIRFDSLQIAFLSGEGGCRSLGGERGRKRSQSHWPWSFSPA